MRRWILATLLSTVTLWGALAMPADGTVGKTDAIREMRQTLADLQRRLDALEAAGESADTREIAALKVLLADAGRRITALEAEADTSPSSPPAPVVADNIPPAAQAAVPVSDQPVMNPRRPSLDWYGSLRVRAGVSSTGQTEIADRFSRLGLSGRVPLADGYTFFGQLELGVNVVNQNPEIVVGGDSGGAYGEGSQAVKSRIGRVGVETPFGTFSWGKQWSPYYDVAGITDMFFTLGGEASGAYGPGDGGIPGTGRAEKAFQYRHTIGPLHVGAQVQNRTRTDENVSYADTWGLMTGLDVTPSLTLAAAFNQVRDGVDKPEPNQPKRGDRAFILGGLWKRGPFQLAADFAATMNHEVDDEGVYFNGRGLELYSQYDWGTKWSFAGGFNYLRPVAGHAGDYRLLNGLGDVTYHFSPALDVNAEIKIEGSQATDGSRLRRHVLIWGVNYNF
jgi:predicted porin